LIKNKYAKVLKKSFKKNKLTVKFKIVPDSEKSKSMNIALSVIKDISRYDRNRTIFIVAFGGGVIGDLAGFVASVYKRGIPYIQIPTTLLAQIDSSIGGKTGLDLETGKNLIGVFYQPRLVLSDVNLLKTLRLRQRRSGLAEAIKYGIIKDKSLLNFIENNYADLLCAKEKKLEFIIRRCSQIKAEIVAKDEKEKRNIRTILNFGHTFAHAIEAATRYKRYNHGEAVGFGILCAADLSLRLGLLRENLYCRIVKIISNVGLPKKIRGVSLEKIIAAHYRDKKFLGKKNRFVLIKNIGHAIIKENIPLGLIKSVLSGRN
jgi:3-dehydroquinate synthase